MGFPAHALSGFHEKLFLTAFSRRRASPTGEGMDSPNKN